VEHIREVVPAVKATAVVGDVVDVVVSEVVDATVERLEEAAALGVGSVVLWASVVEGSSLEGFGVVDGSGVASGVADASTVGLLFVLGLPSGVDDASSSPALLLRPSGVSEDHGKWYPA